MLTFSVSENRVVLKIAGGDYMGKMAGDGNIKLYVKCTVNETGQSYGTQDVVELRKPKLAVTVRMKPCSSLRFFGVSSVACDVFHPLQFSLV